MKTFSTVLLALLCGALCAQEGKVQGYQNPVIPGYYPDPSVVRVDSDYYLVNSSFQFFPGVPLWHSRDLIHWEQIGNVLNRASQLPLKGANCWLGIYAPTIRYHEGRFYMITTNVGNGAHPCTAHPDVMSQGNFLVYTDDIRSGQWSDPIWLQQGGIDPSLLFEDGKCYMTSNPDVGIWVSEINPDTGEQLTEPRRVWDGTGGRHPEAPHLYKRDGWYYLLIAEGGTEVGHSVTMARSKNPYGPYDPCPYNPILYHWRKAAQNNPIQGTGHADLVQAHDSSWWLVNLAFRPTSGNNHHLGRETFLAPVSWPHGGWPLVGFEGTERLDMDVPTLPQTRAYDLPETDDFNATTLGYEWVYLNNPDSKAYALKDGKLVLTAKKGETLDAEGRTVTFVARRQQHISLEVSTEVTADAKADAGLTLYATAYSHYDLYVAPASTGQGQSVYLRYRLEDLTQVNEYPLKRQGTPVALRVQADAEHYRFAFSQDGGQQWQTAGQMNTRYLSSECAGGFTGTVIGLFCTSTQKAAAAFEYFRYKTL